MDTDLPPVPAAMHVNDAWETCGLEPVLQQSTHRKEPGQEPLPLGHGTSEPRLIPGQPTGSWALRGRTRGSATPPPRGELRAPPPSALGLKGPHGAPPSVQPPFGAERRYDERGHAGQSQTALKLPKARRSEGLALSLGSWPRAVAPLYSHPQVVGQGSHPVETKVITVARQGPRRTRRKSCSAEVS